MKKATQDLYEKKLNKDIGERLRGLRKEGDMSQIDFTTAMEDWGINISKSTYSNYECGNTPIPVSYVQAFCDYFDVTTDYLINGTEPETEPETEPDRQITKIINLLTPKEKERISRFLTDIAKCMGEK